MSSIQFPVHFQFNIATLSNDFTATDGSGRSFAYVRQKMFKFKEDIEIFENESRTNLMYKIKADRWLDFSAAYSFYNSSGQEMGKIVRKGWRSMWKARYEIIDENQQILYHVNEESAFTRILDNMLGEIPILNLFTGYVFHPSYLITNENGETVAKLKKLSSFFGRKFNIEATDILKDEHKEKVVLGMMMMILLERRRG